MISSSFLAYNAFANIKLDEGLCEIIEGTLLYKTFQEI